MTVIYKPTSEFWSSVYPDGMTADNVEKELADLEFVADQLSKVYMHVTGQQASKPMIYAEVINSLHDDFITEVVDNEVKQARKELLIELMKFICQERPYYHVRTTFDHSQAKAFEREVVEAIKQHYTEDLK